MEIIALFQQVLAILTHFGGDAIAVGGVNGLLMGTRYLLPGPVDPVTGRRTWETMPAIERWIPLAALFLGIAAGLALDSFTGKNSFTLAAIRGGIATGFCSLGVERFIFITWLKRGM